jgi:hypothetical protein
MRRNNRCNATRRIAIRPEISYIYARFRSQRQFAMQTAAQREGMRKRVAELVRERYGSTDSAALRQLSVKARVHYTSLARYLSYSQPRRTATMRRQTLSAVAMALDVNPQWLVDGQATQQLGVWPLLTPATADCTAADPDEQMVIAVAQLRALAPHLRVRAYRAAIAAAIDAVTNEGASPGDETYRCLMRLDALRRVAPVRVAS